MKYLLLLILLTGCGKPPVYILPTKIQANSCGCIYKGAAVSIPSESCQIINPTSCDCFIREAFQKDIYETVMTPFGPQFVKKEPKGDHILCTYQGDI